MNWRALSDKSLAGDALTHEECRAVLQCPSEELLALVSAGSQVRFHHFGRRVKLNYLMNIKSGICPEDCGYCSQSSVSTAPIDKYPFISPEQIVQGGRRARALGASRLCLVASGRGPDEKEVGWLCEAVRQVKMSDPSLEVCACLGLLSQGQGGKLKEAGVFAYNHNMNTSERFYPSICSTHTYRDRLSTVGEAKTSGLSACSGGIVGMGETDEDIIEMAWELRKLQVDSLPINFLTPVAGTPLAGLWALTPPRCLKILCLFRFLNPKSEIRIAGGREIHMGDLQPLGLYVASSIFIGDYLTTHGQSPEKDWKMIQDLGFEIEGGFKPPRESAAARASAGRSPGSLIQGDRT
jgi:biotin synthase